MKLKLIIILLFTFHFVNVQSQLNRPKDLELKVYRFNNQFKYDSSLTLIHLFLGNSKINNDEKYFGNLYLSFTYKRLFDYPTTLRYLDTALKYGVLTNQKEFYSANIKYQKALSFFDVQEYSRADNLMKELSTINYKYLDEESKSKIFMQEAYLLFRRKNYLKAELVYRKAENAMNNSSPCDLPMIYAKKIELYGALNNIPLMEYYYNRAVISSDSCKIVKYNLYANEMMAKVFEAKKDFKRAFYYFKKYDTYTRIYNEKDHLERLNDLDKKYQSEKKEQQIVLQQEIIKSKNRSIAFLILILFVLILCGLLLFVLLGKRKLEEEKRNVIKYTRQILERTEVERKRIASELHDSISHELLNLKSQDKQNIQNNNEKIDSIIENIRIISRNLHPVLFDRLGLERSVESLAERVQKQNEFLLTTDIKYSGCLSSETELQVYRIIQEGVTNIIKHANAIAGKIIINEDKKNVIIEIKDNGHGFNVSENTNSGKTFGLHNIIERSRTIGGNAKIQSTSRGTSIQITIFKK